MRKGIKREKKWEWKRKWMKVSERKRGSEEKNKMSNAVIYLFIILYVLFWYFSLYLDSIEERYCETAGRRREAFRNLIRFATSFPRAATSWRAIAESRVYENSDRIRLPNRPSSFLYSLALPRVRKSVRTICHVLHLREKSRDCVLIVTPLSSLCIICHNSIAIASQSAASKLCWNFLSDI